MAHARRQAQRRRPPGECDGVMYLHCTQLLVPCTQGCKSLFHCTTDAGPTLPLCPCSACHCHTMHARQEQGAGRHSAPFPLASAIPCTQGCVLCCILRARPGARGLISMRCFGPRAYLSCSCGPSAVWCAALAGQDVAQRPGLVGARCQDAAGGAQGPRRGECPPPLAAHQGLHLCPFRCAAFARLPQTLNL